MTVTVYLNDGPHNFDGFDPASAQLREAVRFDAVVSESVPSEATTTRLLETVFEQLNLDPDREWAQLYHAEGNRSLSVGDVVVLGEIAWTVERSGWAHISTDDLTRSIARTGD